MTDRLVAYLRFNELPGVTGRELEEYIRDAVENWGGQLPPPPTTRSGQVSGALGSP